NSASLSLSNSYSATGITYQWGSGTAPGGPYTAVPGATLSTFVTPTLAANGFYNVIITCTNSGLSFATTGSVAVVTCTYCSGTPSSNTVLPITNTVCSGSAVNLSLLNNYTVSG